MIFGAALDRYLEPPAGPECPNQDCRDGWLHGRDGDGRDVEPERCPDPAHMTDAQRREYVRWMGAGAP